MKTNREIFRDGSTTYYYSSLFFSGQVKKDVFDLYAFVRIVDDFVDKKVPEKDEFEKYYKETINAWKIGSSDENVINAFIELAKRRNFRWEWVEQFFNAMKSDLQGKKYHNYEDLKKYMHGSAEVIGYMMASIMKLPKAAYKYAALQGQAMQYLNFIRDIREDVELGRNYLGLDIHDNDNTQKWDSSIREHIHRYKEVQKKAEEGYKFIEKKFLTPIKTASDMYMWTADQIDRDPKIVLRKKVKPSRQRVAMNIIKNTILI